jgi:zinc transport system substrate-binding protein
MIYDNDYHSYPFQKCDISNAGAAVKMAYLKKRFYVSREIVGQLSIVIVSAIAMGVGGCATNTNPSANSPVSPQAPSPQAASPEKLQVVTTFTPITDFTKAVAGDRADVKQLLPTNIGPHDYQAKPEDAQQLAKADVLVKNGLEMESFLEDLVKNAGNTSLKVIDSSQGVQTVATESPEGHDHAHESKENRSAGADHDHGESNPHIWLDPKRALQQVTNIRDGLIAADPAGKAVYAANANAYIDRLKQLDAEFTEKLRPFTGKTFVTYHDFAPYFAQSYNLKAQFLVGIPEENAAPGDVQRVINAAKSYNLKTLLTEPQVEGNSFSALAKDLKVQVSYFDPMETAGEKGMQPDYYFTVMRQNLTNLQTALAGNAVQSLSPSTLLPTIAIVSQPIRLQFQED